MLSGSRPGRIRIIFLRANSEVLVVAFRKEKKEKIYFFIIFCNGTPHKHILSTGMSTCPVLWLFLWKVGSDPLLKVGSAPARIRTGSRNTFNIPSDPTIGWGEREGLLCLVAAGQLWVGHGLHREVRAPQRGHDHPRQAVTQHPANPPPPPKPDIVKKTDKNYIFKNYLI